MAERVPFRGGLTCSCVVTSLPWVEEDLRRHGLLTGNVRIFQLGYRTDVEASANTHARGGCIDVDGTPTAAEIDVWRLWGWTMQARYLSGVAPHCHGWPYKCPHLSPAAQRQEADWDRKDAGLTGAGKVQGRWPVQPWPIALRERKAILEEEDMPTAEEIVDELLKSENLHKIARAVWNEDIIPNPGDTDNPTSQAKNAIKDIKLAVEAEPQP